MLLALSCLALLPPKITLTLPATPVVNAVKEIGRLSDTQLYTDDSVLSDVVCIGVQDVPLDDLKAKLAAAIGASWVERDGKQILTRPDWMRKQQEDEALDARAKDIERSIALRPELPRFDESYIAGFVGQVNAALAHMNETIINDEHDKARRAQWAALEKTPASRFLERLARNMPARLLATLPPDYQVCYSNQPNASERRLPFDLKPILAQFQDEQRLFLRSLQSKDTAKWNVGDDRRMWVYDADPDCRRILLIVSMNRNTRMPSYKLLILDADGWASATPTMALTAPPLAADDLPKEDPSERRIAFSPPAQEWPWVFSWLSGPAEVDENGRLFSDLLKPWIPRLLNPEREEPLNLTASEAALGYGKSKGMPIVALIPDRAISWPSRMPPNWSMEDALGMTPSSFVQRAYSQWQAKVVTQDGWLLLRPIYFADARKERFDRAALGKYFRQVRAENRVSVDSAATYAGSVKSELLMESPDPGSRVYGVAERFQGDYEPKQLTIWYNRALLRFLGKLSPVQRRTLLEGETLTVSQLGASGRAAFDELLYSRDMLERLFKKVDVYTDDVKKIRGHASDEVWEKLPNGIPGTAVIRCSRTEEPVIFTEEGDIRLLSSWTPESLGIILAGRDGDLGQNLPKMTLGGGVAYDFRFEITPDVVGTANVRELALTKRTAYSRIEDFPIAIRSQIAQGFRKEKERLAKRRSEGQGTAPPPTQG